MSRARLLEAEPEDVVDDRPAYPVTDCPEHPSSALAFPSGVFCFACGKEVRADSLDVVAVPASDELKAEARAAWQSSRVIRLFADGMKAAS